ncbi:MAG: hypothetical protein RIS70_1628 [Planctomycetota bacterium]
MTQNRSAVVLVFDRLGASFLGPYGNTWLETSGWNRLASESMLWEQCLSDSAELPSIYRSFWYGQHAVAGDSIPAWPSLIERLNQAGVHTVLLTDDPVVARHPGAKSFEECVELTDADNTEPCEHPADCAISQFLARLLSIQEELPEPYLIWAHSRGMAGPWDAPLESRDAFRDEEDPPAYEGVEPPRLRLPAGYDPDQVFPWVQAYAAQVQLLDVALQCYLDDPRRLETTALAVTSARGFPLGEHRMVGEVESSEDSSACGISPHETGNAQPLGTTSIDSKSTDRLHPRLYQETLHVPLVWRDPNGNHAGWRRQDFVQHPDLPASLLAWFQLEPDPRWWGRSFLVERSAEIAASVLGRAGSRERALRTPAWFLREDRSSEESRAELYVKPDDRYEINDIASRCPDIVELLQSAVELFQQYVDRQQRDEMPKLPREITELF